jgi:predicted XRE-type DNA-binding protein
MTYTNNEIIKRIEKAKRDRKFLTHITNKSKLSTEDKMKMGLCKHFVRFLVVKHLKLKELAELIDIPVPRLSEITNYKINKFTVDQLLKNLSALAGHDPHVREYLVFLNQAVELPILSIAKTKKLTRDLKVASL